MEMAKGIVTPQTKKATSFVGYMCRTEYEVERLQQGGLVTRTLKTLKELQNCVDECGIVEVEVKLIRVVQAGTMYDPSTWKRPPERQAKKGNKKVISKYAKMFEKALAKYDEAETKVKKSKKRVNATKTK